MPKSYLIYETQTAEQLPVALFYSVLDVARFLGLSYREAHRVCAGHATTRRYGVYVDVFDPVAEGQMNCDHLPPQNTEHKNQKEARQDGR